MAWELRSANCISEFLAGVSKAKALKVLHLGKMLGLTQPLQSQVATALLETNESIDELNFFEGYQDKSVIPVLAQTLQNEKFPGGVTIQINDDEIKPDDFRIIYKALNEEVKIRWGIGEKIAVFFVQGRHKIMFKTNPDNLRNVKPFVDHVPSTALEFPIGALDVLADEMVTEGENYDCYICHDTLPSETPQAESYLVTEKVLQKFNDHGLQYWIDRNNLTGVINKAMNSGLKSSSKVVLLLTRKYLELTSDPNHEKTREFHTAILKKKVQNVVVVVMEEAVLDKSTWLISPVGECLAGLAVHNFSSEERMNQRIDQVVACIKT